MAPISGSCATRSTVAAAVSGVLVQVDHRSRARCRTSASCSCSVSAPGPQLSMQMPQALQASGLIASDSSSPLSFFCASASWKNGWVSATGTAPNAALMRPTPSSIACLRSSGSGAFSISHASDSSSMPPKVAAGLSAFLPMAIIRAASFEATWRTGSAPVCRIPASISAAGAAAVTPMALSGQ